MTRRSQAFNLFRYAVLSLYSGVALFPVFWIISTSLKSETEWNTVPATWVSAHPTLENFAIVLGLFQKFFHQPFPEGSTSFPSILPSMMNSFLISGSATILALAVGTVAAYSLSRCRVGGDFLLVSLLGVRFLHPVVLSIPLLILFTTLRIEGSHFSVIVTYTALTVPYAVWLMKSFIDEVPAELEEAAISDGCSNLSTFVKVVVPLLGTGLAVTGLFIFILDWTEFFMALTLTDRNSLTAGFQIYNYATKEGNLFGPQSAGAMLALILPIILGLAIQKYLIRGLTFGTIKTQEGDRRRESRGSKSDEQRRQVGARPFSRERSINRDETRKDLLRPRKGKRTGLMGEMDEPKRLATLFLAPLVVLLLVLVAVPLLFELYLSLTGWQANIMGNWSAAPWVWLENYRSILADGRFVGAIARTFLIVVAALVLESSLGLGLAMLFLDRFVGKKILTSIILIPMMLIPLVIGFTFNMLFLPAGPINLLLGIVLRQEVSVHWLTEANLAIIPVILAEVYEWTPLMFMIFLAGFLAIPREIDNAALILGSSAWQRFRHISLPMLKPTIVVALTICGVEAAKTFDIVYVMTRGGPGTQTETIATYFYEVGFRYSRFSYIAAGALVVLVLIVLGAMQAMKAMRFAAGER